ncbi:hypothetical protein K3172_03430 [Qipengyuania sp. 6B39]|uniref:hypothetical protein n=1 Tax=Qipengyuania proteolytica TaxID=2867239 RepID=UPI001C8A64D9|nr:hypothetical protein [Qipengyuania proteolytica]MBX7494907.1 hypothetical protein [Qipengyuania proteolytica]
MIRRFAPAVLPLAAALSLAACGEPADTTYEADATDEGGGELIVSDVDPAAAPVDAPDTPMTNVPDAQATGTAPDSTVGEAVDPMNTPAE